MKLKQFPPCSRCRTILNTFIDLTAEHDRSLGLIFNLLMCSTDQELLDSDSLVELGHTIDQYLQKKRLCEHVFVGRTIKGGFTNDPCFKAELYRLRAYLQETKKDLE